MIEIVENGGVIYYASKDAGELDALAEYLEEVFPDGEQERVRWDKSLKFNLLKVDMGDDAVKKDFNDMLDLYRKMR